MKKGTHAQCCYPITAWLHYVKEVSLKKQENKKGREETEKGRKGEQKS
jgi:hypothetical protein